MYLPTNMSIDTIQQIWTKDSSSAIQIRASETIPDKWSDTFVSVVFNVGLSMLCTRYHQLFDQYDKEHMDILLFDGGTLNTGTLQLHTTYNIHAL